MTGNKRIILSIVALALVVGGLSLAVGQNVAAAQEAPAAAHYTVQFVVIPNKPSLYLITDNATNELHIYENTTTACQLKQTIDLTQAGEEQLVSKTRDARPEATAKRHPQSVLR